MGWTGDGAEEQAETLLYGDAGRKLSVFADTLEKECVFGIKHPDLDAAKQAMERLGIYEYRTHHPNTLSGGQKQPCVPVSACRFDVPLRQRDSGQLYYVSVYGACHADSVGNCF